ncbi:MAG: hypothetical protein FWH01_06850 [Oscillospiraceae bacterium]|nr:hypothetical protein [Oscillospiraceae bacterium]
MSYTSKKNIVSVAAGIALMVAYIIYARGAKAPAAVDVKAWAVALLVFIGIGVGAQIVLQVLFHIALAIGLAAKEEIKAGSIGGTGGTGGAGGTGGTAGISGTSGTYDTAGKNSENEAERAIKAEMVEDEWSKIIELKASRVGYVSLGIGVCAAVVALAAGAETVIALHIIFGMSALSSIAEGVTSIFYHERGVRQ